MERLNIPVFSGQGTTAMSSRYIQDQALNSSLSPMGALLLSSCLTAFHSELSSLSYADLETIGVNLADFDKPSTLLVISRRSYVRNSVISGTRLLLVQTLLYLEWATKTVKVTSGTTFAELLGQNSRYRTGILGFSSGIIAACVIGTSATWLDFISNAVSAFRVALWIGVRTECYRSRSLAVSSLQRNDDHPWSCVLLGMALHAANEAISSFSLQYHESSSLYVTAVNDEQCITVSGRPDILNLFKSTLPETVSVRDVSVYTLYHSPAHIHSVRREVLADLSRREILFPTCADIICPIRSTFTGETLEANQKVPLVQSIIDMILIHPVNWDKVTSAVAQSVPRAEVAHLVNIGPGLGLLRSIEKALQPGRFVTHNLVAEDQRRLSILEPLQDHVAIVGMAVNMPGASSTSELWEALEKGLNTVTEVPVNRFRVSDYATSQSDRSMKAHTGNFVHDVDKFDHEFFNVSPREARSMDPQIRILLHTAYEALEDSGYVPNASRSFNPETFGCYVGAATGDYVQNLRNNIDVYYSTGTLRAFLSGRISYAMGFGGPSVVVDTACSSSLVAIHQACRALLNGDCNATLAGGVNVITSPDAFIGLDRAHFLSPTGQCKVFDASADGYCRGEGCGLFVLKRLSDAQAENDRILGVIRGVEVNQSGTARSITQPHIPTQVRLFQQLFERSGVDPGRVNVMEAHGTGTQAGDASEIESVRRIFAACRTAKHPVHITSIKANIGHLEAASGAAGLAKLLLMLQHRTIPRLISLVNLNPSISELASDHISIDSACQPWNPVEESSPRMALLNNFGAAGSNCALLLEEFVSPDFPKKISKPSTMSYLFGLSAKTEIALDKMRSRLVDWLNGPDSRNTPLSDIAYALTARRQIYEYRTSLTAHTSQELVKGLLSSPSHARVTRKDGKAAFVFSGQGGQYFGMGGSLYGSVPLFRGIIDRCHSILVTSGFAGVVQVISPERHCDKLSEIEMLEVYQTATFSLEYGLAQLWISWGVTPTLVVGHSLGEYVAQTVAGVLTLRDALILVANRAHLITQKCLPGSTGMMAVNLDTMAIGKVLASSSDFSAINIACYNSPDDHVVSGPVSSLQALKSYLDQTIHCKNIILAVEFGYHSSAMRPIQDGLTSLAQRITISPPEIPIISNVFGEVVLPGDASVFNPQYYTRHCTEPVLFDSGIKASVASPALPTIDAWIEMGPHATVLPTLRRHPAIRRDVLLLTSMRKQEHDWTPLSSALARLYTSPFEINWRNVFSHLPFLSNTSLPTYPWSKTSFWVGFEEGTLSKYKATYTAPETGDLELPRVVPHAWLEPSPSRNGILYMYKTPMSHLSKVMYGHRVRGQPLCPASAYQELALAGIEASILSLHGSLDGHSVIMHDIDFSRPLIYTEDARYPVQTTVILDSEDEGSWKVVTETHEGSQTHAHGSFQVRPSSSTVLKFGTVNPIISHRVTSVISRSDNKLFTTSSIYEVFFPPVVTYGKDYHVIQTLTISTDNTEGYATVQLLDTPNFQHDRFVIHPVLMDAILQVAGFVGNMHGTVGDAFICSKVALVEVIPHLIDNAGAPYGVYVNCAWLPGGDMLADLYMLQPGQDNRIVTYVKGAFFRKVPLATLEHGLALAAAPVLPNAIDVLSVTQQSWSIPDPVLPPEVHDGLQRLEIDPQHHGTIVKSAVPKRCPVDSDVTLSSSHAPAVRLPDVGNNDCQSGVKALLADVLGLELNKLPEDADLDLLGLDSLASIEAHHALQSHFDIVLPGNLFAIHNSARAVQTFITGRLACPKSLDANKCSGSPCAVHRVVDSSDLAHFSEPIPISVQRADRPGTTPLVLIHDGSGLVEYIHSLPSLDRDLWGIYNPHFMSSQPWESVVSMAAAYAKYTKEAVGFGPVLLGGWNQIFSPRHITNALYATGWSFGGIIAFEVARKLLDSGVVVKGVVLIDSPSPLNHVPLSDELIDSIVKFDGPNSASSNRRSLLVKRQFQMNSQILVSYDPAMGSGPYPQLVLLRSCEGYYPSGGPEIPEWLSHRGDRLSAIVGWEKIVGAPVKYIDIAGNHFQPFQTPFVRDRPIFAPRMLKA
ncbi:polyketide beta-ketoacyl-synthase [Lactarius pseudohatsudake]|nr:polyketide beta-ketoacyl-synthase [Lactarius pseudohatsudake]